MKKLISSAMLGLMLVAAPLAAHATTTSTDTAPPPSGSHKTHKKHTKHSKKKSGSGTATGTSAPSTAH